jgi:prepilin-type N-terminal cleavage/methylation domain-containing protein
LDRPVKTNAPPLATNPRKRPPGDRTRSRPGGFSLVEILVALALLGSALVGVAAAVSLGRRSSHEGRRISEATHLASSILGEIEAWGFEETMLRLPEALSVDGGELDAMTDPSARRWKTSVGERLTDGTGRVRIEKLGGTGGGDCSGLRLTATVTWRRGETRRSVSLVTVRF